MKAILEAEQIPAGMELFSAADEEQWQIIKETIDVSDYYILILGMRYGSVFEEGEYAGISYTEREFDYADSIGIPILAYIIDDDAEITPGMVESDPAKAARLIEFKGKAKKHTDKFWKNADELSTEVTHSIYKSIMRGNRPGWIRTTEFNVEESMAEILRLTRRMHELEAQNVDLRMENNRRPRLHVEICPIITEDGEEYLENMVIKDNNAYFHVAPVYIKDAENGIDYNDRSGREIHVEKDEVRLFRYLYKNSFPVCFYVKNGGDARATGVRVKLTFPDNLMIMSPQELYEYEAEEMIAFSKNAYENWDSRFYAPDGCVENENEYEGDKFISIDELISIPDIANLLDPADCIGVTSIFPGEMLFDKKEVRHQDSDYFGEVYILPTASGNFTINCKILCNELAEAIEQDIFIEVR